MEKVEQRFRSEAMPMVGGRSYGLAVTAAMLAWMERGKQDRDRLIAEAEAARRHERMKDGQ